MKKKIVVFLIPLLLVLSFLAVLFLQLKKPVDGTSIKDLVFDGTVDVSWYDDDETEFVISTADQLYGVAKLSEFTDFEGKTIKLGADIIVNDGNATDWKEAAPERKWYPIEGFAGTFDGQGYSISGIYGKANDMAMGLFIDTKEECVIQDFKLVNTYYDIVGSGGTASIAGGTGNGGTFKRIYTDAILNADGNYCAGIVNVVTEPTKISECWFDGTFYECGRLSGGIVGVVTDGGLKMSHCLNSGDINSTYTIMAPVIGGLCGLVENMSIELSIKDSLNASSLTVLHDGRVGSVAGFVDVDTASTFSSTFTTTESFKTAVGAVNGELAGGAIAFDEEDITGYGAYQWTNLNFKKYWAVDMEGTPILKYFADDVPSLKGIKKAFDTSWYDEDKSEFTIDTVEELYGFAILSVDTDFKGKTVKLGADISINEGNAADWAKTAPENRWISIKKFAGTFDGQGHTIRGVYLNGGDAMGLFERTTADSTIKNFRLENSYLNSDAAGNAYAGSIVGRGGGTIDTVYSNAILTCAGIGCGGIIGQAEIKNTKVTNCWFDGNISMITDNGYGGAGIIGIVQGIQMTVEHCLNTGSISGERTENYVRLGGLCGVLGGKSKVTIKDSLNAGIITADSTARQVGTIIGFVGTNSTATIDTVYATAESGDKTIGQEGTAKSVTGGVLVYAESELLGYKGYQWTSLDFDNYWAVVMKDTPILKSFATTVPSLAGIKKMFDTSWYNKDNTVFTLRDAADLHGLVQLSAQGIDFKDKTVRLGADITVNKGNAANWAKSAPENNWSPIPSFAGTFDGKGYTISGIYGKGTSTMGMFGKTTADTVIKNFRLENSYFSGTGVVGGIVAQGGGTFDTIYSDVIIASTGSGSGGIIGQLDTGDKAKINNCWFAGEIILSTEEAHSGGGMAGIVTGKVVLNITNCLNSGAISATRTTNYNRLGGICGVIGGTTKVTMQDCLNAGKIQCGVDKQVGSICGFVGSNANVTITDVYATLEGYAKTILGTGTINGKVVRVNEQDIYGKKAVENAPGLDYTKHWTTITKRTPILTSFIDKTPDIEGIEVTSDTSWYNASVSEFTITTVAQLYGLAELSEETDFAGKTIKLGADIIINQGNAADWAKTAPENRWDPIQEFAGTFDGRGYTISGLYRGDGRNLGLFAKTTETSVVKNLRILNSYFACTTATGNVFIGSVAGQGGGTFNTIYSDAIITCSGMGSGGIIGQVNAAGTNRIINCWFAGKINMVTENGYSAGGMTGHVNGVALNIENCLNSGTISAERTSNYNRLGGMCGVLGGKSKVTIKDSLNVGKIKPGVDNQVGSIVGFVGTSSSLTVDDTYATKESYTRTIYGNVSGTVNRVTEAEITGENAKTNAVGLDYTKYWETVANGTPVLKIFVSGQPPISEEPEEFKADTSWYAESEKDKADGYYIIDSKEDLYGFAELASKGNTFAGEFIKLGREIIVNEVDAENAHAIVSGWAEDAPDFVWTPIEEFAGTFDGKGNTIRGLYVGDGRNIGLFSKTTATSVIQNLRIEDSYFGCTTATGNVFIGSVVGQGSGTIDSVYSNAIINCSGVGVGGIIGKVITTEKENGITNCWFAGEINMTTNNGYTGGGIVGVVGEAGYNVTLNIEHCLNTGTVSAKRTNGYNRIGGMCGVLAGASVVTIKDSLNTGKITPGIDNQVGAIIGMVGGSARASIENVYATTDSYDRAIYGNATGEVTQVAEVAIKGYSAYLNAKTLNYYDPADATTADGKWVVIDGKIPEIRSLTTETEYLSRVDRSWYDANPNALEYSIGTLGQLYGLVEVSKETNLAGKVINLTSSITINTGDADDWGTTPPEYEWEPIQEFAGTFNGHGNTISGLYIRDGRNAGLFAKTTITSVIQNLRIENSYFAATTATGDAFIGSVAGQGGGTFDTIYSDAIIACTGVGSGGIIGQVNTAITDEITNSIDNCWFAGEIKIATNSGHTGGGMVGSVNGVALNITDCLNAGAISATRTNNYTRVAGMCGVLAGSAVVNITDCLNVGQITSEHTTQAGSVIGFVGGSARVVFTDTYTTEESYTKSYSAQGSVTRTVTRVAKKNLKGDQAETNASGLNYSEDGAWSIVEKQTPVLTSFLDKTPPITEIEPNTSWYTDNPNLSEYTISTVEQLYGLAELVNGGNPFTGITIKLNGTDGKFTVNAGTPSEWKTPIEWIPIGNSTNNAFGGIFVGNGNTIQGLYSVGTENIGLFGVTTANAQISNLRVENTYFVGEKYVGAIAGQGGGIFEKIYSRAELRCSVEGCGGIVGQMSVGTTNRISECWFAGSVTITGSTGWHGAGMVGGLSDGVELTIINCLNAGTITNERTSGHARIGGMCGVLAGTSKVKIEKSLNTGSVSSPCNARVAAIIGFVGTDATAEVENVYASDKSCANGIVGTYSGKVNLVPHDNLLSDAASAETGAKGLDFADTGAWKTVEGSTPILKSLEVKATSLSLYARLMNVLTSIF